MSSKTTKTKLWKTQSNRPTRAILCLSKKKKFLLLKNNWLLRRLLSPQTQSKSPLSKLSKIKAKLKRRSLPPSKKERKVKSLASAVNAEREIRKLREKAIM